jgi:hypothetical protein
MRRERSTRSSIVRAMQILMGWATLVSPDGLEDVNLVRSRASKVLAYHNLELLNVDGSQVNMDILAVGHIYILELRLKMNK